MPLFSLSCRNRCLRHNWDVIALVACAFFAILSCGVPIAASAQSIVVGGKDYTEQLLIAEMTSQLLSAKGLTVEKRSGYGTTSLRRVQEAGDVDLYWEYTGTSLRQFNKVTEKLNPAEAYARVKQLDLEKGLVWLRPSRVNNTYALAMRRADAMEKGIATISDLADRVNRGELLHFASGFEFFDRADGLLPLQQAYGFRFDPARVVRLSTNMVYEVLRDRTPIDVGMVFATDGRIPAYDLLLLSDDRGFFPDYTMAPVVRAQALKDNPGIAPYIDELSAVLDNETMARLSGMIDLQGVPLTSAAEEFLRSHGLL